MKSKKRKTFSVGADVRVWTHLSIEAGSLEEALEQARGLKVTDFVTIEGDHSDSQLEIAGVADNDLPNFG